MGDKGSSLVIAKSLHTAFTFPSLFYGCGIAKKSTDIKLNVCHISCIMYVPYFIGVLLIINFVALL